MIDEKDLKETLHKKIGTMGAKEFKFHDNLHIRYYTVLGGILLQINYKDIQFIPASEVLESLSKPYNELISQLM